MLDQNIKLLLLKYLLDRDVPRFRPPEFVQAVHESGDPPSHPFRGARAQEPNGRLLRHLLRVRAEWCGKQRHSACKKRPPVYHPIARLVHWHCLSGALPY